MWCDSFDADLLAVVPGAAGALGDTTGVELRTYSHLTGGKINCPSAWHTYHGLASFFWTADEHRPDASYWTDAPVSACTFLEAVRDEWVHDCVLVVNRSVVWRPPSGLMSRLMYDLRGWPAMTGEVREETRAHVLRSLEKAAGRLRAVLGT